MFRKLVAIEPIRLAQQWEARLTQYTRELMLYTDIPAGNDEIIRRIGDADGVLLSYTSAIDREVLLACKRIRYIGMCCSLYSPESANVEVRTAEELGITVRGVRDYGDEGVAEYVVSELVRLLHGFGGVMWRDFPTELTGLKVGIVGMGTTGTLLARTLRFFGAEIAYFSRTRKPELEAAEGYAYLPLHELLERSEILCTCLNKNVVLLGEEEFRRFGEGKILVNTCISPSHEVPALGRWLEHPGNYALSDTASGMDPSGGLQHLPNVFCTGQAAGMTSLARERLGKKVCANIEAFFEEEHTAHL